MKPVIRVKATGQLARVNKMRRLMPSIAEKALQDEGRLLHKIVHRNVLGPQRKKNHAGPVGTGLPVGRRSNKLQRSVKLARQDRRTYRVYVSERGCNYARWVHEGHRAYTVWPKNKTVLAWVTSGNRPGPGNAKGWRAARRSGRARFARSVSISSRPGTKFLTIGVQSHRRQFKRRMNRRIWTEMRRRW